MYREILIRNRHPSAHWTSLRSFNQVHHIPSGSIHKLPATLSTLSIPPKSIRRIMNFKDTIRARDQVRILANKCPVVGIVLEAGD